MAGPVGIRGCKVYLDGIEMQHVMGFNIEQGWVECYCTSPSHYATEDAEVDDILRSRLYGHIEIWTNDDYEVVK